MTKKMLSVLTALVLIVVFGMNLRADNVNGTGPAGSDPASNPIVVDAGWYGFCFGGAGSPATVGCQNDGIGVTGNDITFTATGPVYLNVTDAFQKGDTFDVYVNGPLSYTTTGVPIDPLGAVTDPNLAFADPTYSHGSVELGAGSYTVDIFANQSPYGGGGAYVEAVTAPEPNSLLLMVIGLIGVGAGLKKRFTTA